MWERRTDDGTRRRCYRQVGYALGDLKFTERQQATEALKAIGFPALFTLRKAAKDNDAEIAQRAKQLVEIIENSLDQLLADYRGYGLPLPPEDAKLVRFESGGRYILNGKLMPPTYFLGFLLRPATKDKPALCSLALRKSASIRSKRSRWSSRNRNSSRH